MKGIFTFFRVAIVFLGSVFLFDSRKVAYFCIGYNETKFEKPIE